MHFTAALTSAVLSTMLGFYFSIKIRCELKQLTELKSFVIFLRAGIANTIPLAGILRTYSQRYDGAFADFFEMLIVRLGNRDADNIAKLWNECVDEGLKETVIDRPTKRFIKELGVYLDYRESEAKLMCIDSFLDELKRRIDEKNKDISGKSRAYKACGFAAGLMLMLVML